MDYTFLIHVQCYGDIQSLELNLILYIYYYYYKSKMTSVIAVDSQVIHIS